MGFVLQAGVRPGGLQADYELKNLICYILWNIGKSMPVSSMIGIFVEEEIGNYFEVTSAAAGLVGTGHIVIEDVEGEPCYRLTELGTSTAEALSGDLPPAIREKASNAAKHSMKLWENRMKTRVTKEKVSDGYLLTLTIPDVGSDLLSTTIFLPDEGTAEAVAQRFLEEPVLVYQGIVAVLTGNLECVGPLLSEWRKSGNL